MEYVDYDSRWPSAVATITLKNPPANALVYAMLQELDEAILKARISTAVSVIIITGADKFFCAGADLNSLFGQADPEYKYNFCLYANEILMRLENTPKLVIAAINGHAIGGGLEIALAADIRIAKEGKSKIGLPEVGLGVLPGLGGAQRLSKLIGKNKALEFMIEGKVVSPEKALFIGLVNKVIDSDDFLGEVAKYAERFVAPNGASQAVGLIKRAVSGADLPTSEGQALERELLQRLFLSLDSKEGLEAYFEKRSPRFLGK